jgi:copper oxidase (laccase) domain-containing protein
MNSTAPTATKRIEFIDFGPSVQAGFTLRDPRHRNGFSTRLTDPDTPVVLAEISGLTGIALSHTVLPANWPHGKRVATISGISDTVIDQRFGTRNPNLPIDAFGFANSCDGLVTKSENFTLGVQSADCPMLFMHDPQNGVIGAIHCGWKSLVRGIIISAVRAFKDLGSKPADVLAYLSPGAGDRVYEFGITDATRAIFEDVSREGLLDPQNGFITNMTSSAREQLSTALNRKRSDITNPAFALTALASEDLRLAGLVKKNIRVDPRSSILEPSMHSARRDGLASGRSIGFIRLLNP